jgi:DNA polymerase III subunit alpha
VVAAIVRGREVGGYTSFADFVHRVDPVVLNKRVVEALAKAGAFDSLGIPRSDLLTMARDTGEAKVTLRERVEDTLEAVVTQKRNEQAGQFSLFGGDAHHQLSEIPAAPDALPNAVLLAAEKEMLGLYVSDHPLLAVEDALRAVTDLRLADAAHSPNNGATRTAGGLVTRLAKRFTKKGEPMGTFVLEDLAGAMEVVVFPAVYAKTEPYLLKDAIVCVKGKVEVRDESEPPKLVAQEIWRPNLETGGDPLVLRIPKARAPALIDPLKEVLQAHPGSTPVQVHLVGDDGEHVLKLRIADSLRVERRNGLYAELKTLLGSAALVESRA